MYILLLFINLFCPYLHGNATEISAGKEDVSPILVYDARCQSLDCPVGVGESYPDFSWKISSDEQSVVQTAYQIRVASSLQKLEADPDMWNSGKISSGQNTFIHYAGKPLSSATKYYWKVSIWTNKRQKSFDSKPSFFITGLLRENEWDNARWIGYKVLPDSLKVFPGVHGNGDQLGNKAKERDVIPYFRREFTVRKKIKQALVFVSGLGQYVLFLNGKRIDSSSFLDPAWSDYTKRCYYNTYDVTSVLKPGSNVIGSIVGNGFLYIDRERYRKLVIAAGYPMLRLKMIIQYTDGSTKEVVTDHDWKTAPSAITYSGIYGGEDFDADKIQQGWSTTAFNDDKWKHVVIVPSPGGKMQAQESYPVIVNEIFKPVSIDSSRTSIRVYDFGQNISGIIRLQGSGPKGYRIRIIPAELLNDNHTPDQRATGHPYYWQYTLNGNGEEAWQPLFSYYGFRYVGIEVFDSLGNQTNINTVHISSLLSLHTQNGSPEVGTFSCSDTLFNQIFELIQWGIRNNMSDVSTDCPHREKLGWLEQAHLMGNSIQYNYDILRFYSKIVDDMKDAQLPDGLVPDIAPEYVVFRDGFRDSPEWGSACVLVPWYIYQWYGDTGVLRQSYAMMKRYVAYLGSKASDNLLAYGLGDWFDLGPKSPGVSQLTPLGLTATAFYFYDAAIVGKVAAVLGDSAAMKQYALLSENIRQSFNRKYFNDRTNVYATGSQTSYAIPLYFGMADSLRYNKIVTNLIDSVRSNHYALTAGDIGFRYLVQVLENNQAYQMLYKMNNRSDVPGYGYQISKGATTLTESWQALRYVSNDHMMLGHLMEWFYSGLGGIKQQPGSVGYKQILIAPQFVNEINRVKCTYNSINGPIAVHWKRLSKNRIQLDISVPANTTADIVLPSGRQGLTEEAGYFFDHLPGNNNIFRGRELSRVEVQSGNYHFICRVKGK
jgi:hypothetical protein